MYSVITTAEPLRRGQARVAGRDGLRDVADIQRASSLSRLVMTV